MENIQYPLLYYQLRENAVLGLLVGTDYQVVEKDLRSVKALLSDYLQKQYKKNDTYPFFDIEAPRLKVFHIKIRPTFRERRGSFPMPNFINVPVPAVYGQVTEGYYECFLPLLEQSFYYYDAKQFESLVQHFTTNTLNQYSPEQLYRMVQYPAPEIDFITLRVNTERPFNWGKFNYVRKYKTLQRLTERYPYPKHLKRAAGATPEAAWEMEEEVSIVLSKILHTRSNVLIVGKPGVGKSAVLTQAIRKITQHTKKQSAPFTFWRIMPQRITASAKYLGDWEETVESLIQELELANGILWIINMIQLLLIGGQGPEDSVAAFLLTYLRQGKLQLIGETTPAELESMRRLLPGFVEHFQIVTIDDPSEKKVQAILQQFIQYAHDKYRIDVDADAAGMAYRLLLRFYPYESFPGKGIKFLAQCVSEAKLSHQQTVDKKLVIDHFVKQTGMPESFLRDDLLLDQQELRRYFQQRIIGQPAAVEKLCEIVKIFKAGLNNPNRPISTLIFAGPTGVGKTASAKSLADYFFGKGQKKFPLIRIDMSEFQHPSQINRLIGAGREVGQLVKEIREKPFSVLLLDEVEKANPSIFDALLTVLDEGMLTDAYGRITNFRNAIIIMTTNLGASNLQSIGFSQTTSEDQHYRSAIERHFRPEFINRVDGIVLFSPLDKSAIRQIAIKELEELKKREGFQKRRLNLDFTPGIVAHLSRTGFDERYGARPLQRALEQSIVSPIASWLLEHPQAYDQHLRIDYNNGIRIERRSP